MSDEEEIKKRVLKALKNEQEIVINRCWGGFSLSIKAVRRYAELSGFQIYIYLNKGDYSKEECERVDTDEELIKDRLKICWYFKKDFGKTINKLPEGDEFWFDEKDIKRDDEILVQVVKELGSEANGQHANLKVVKIPSDVEWEIDNYDGMETIEEKHRKWN